MSDTSFENNASSGFIQKFCSYFRSKSTTPVFPESRNNLLENPQQLQILKQFQQQQLLNIKLQVKSQQSTQKLDKIVSQNKDQVEYDQNQKSEFQNHSQLIKSLKQSFKESNNHQQVNKSQIEQNFTPVQVQNMSMLQSEENISNDEVELLKNELQPSQSKVQQLQNENQIFEVEINGLKYNQSALLEPEKILFTQGDELIIQNILTEEIQNNFDSHQFLERINQNRLFSQLKNEVILRNIQILEEKFRIYRNEKLSEFIQKSNELEQLILKNLIEIPNKKCYSSKTLDDLQLQQKQIENYFNEKHQMLENQKCYTLKQKLMMERPLDKSDVFNTQPKQEHLLDLNDSQKFSNKEYVDLIAQNLLVIDEFEQKSNVSSINDISDSFDNFQNNCRNSSTSIIEKSQKYIGKSEISIKSYSQHFSHRISQVKSSDQVSQSQNLTNSMRSIINQICQRCQCLINGPTIQTNCQHSYHQECFDEMLEQQIFNSKMTEIKCFCNQKLDNKILVQVSRSKQNLLKDQLYQNQLSVIKLQLQNQKLIVQCSNDNCKFFCINPSGKQVKQFKCFQCEK